MLSKLHIGKLYNNFVLAHIYVSLLQTLNGYEKYQFLIKRTLCTYYTYENCSEQRKQENNEVLYAP